MKKISIVLAIVALTIVAVFLVACGNSDAKYIGTWQDATDATSTFTISKGDKGLVLQTSGESSAVEADASGDTLTVDGAKFSLDEQKQELSADGLFDSKIIFKKISGEQK